MNDEEMDFVKYLINEFARKQIIISKEVYQEIKNYIASSEGQLAFYKFKRTKIPKYLKTKNSMGFNSYLRNIVHNLPEHIKKGL